MTELEQLKNDLVKIQERINKLENPTFEVGKWYKGINGHLWFIERLCEYGQKSYGFCSSGAWDDSANRYSNFREFRLATDKEVEEALIKEAIRRGFKEGVTIIPYLPSYGYTDRSIYILNTCTASYEKHNNALRMGGSCIFHNGVWVEIIKEEPIKIGGHEVKKYDSNYKIGCKLFARESISSLAALMYEQDFKTVSFDGIETDLKTINKILTL